DVSRLTVALQAIGRFPPVDPGQTEIHQDEIRLRGPRQRHALRPVGRHQRGVSPALEASRERIAARLVVFDDQDGGHGRNSRAHAVPTVTGSSTASTTSIGSRTVKHDPRSGKLSTEISPPISRQKRDTIARPRPVPPYLRVVVTSAWLKGSKILADCSSVIPTPLSVTANTIDGCALARPRATSTVMAPSRVNLMALLSRLSRICRVFIRSACIVPR